MGLLQPSLNTCITATSTISSVNLPLPCTSVTSIAQLSPKNGESSLVPSPWPNLPACGAPITSLSSAVPVVTPIVAPMLIPVMNSLVTPNEVTASCPTTWQQVVLERPELPDLGKAVAVEPMDDTPPSPQPMESTTNPPTPATADLSSPPTPAAMQVNFGKTVTLLENFFALHKVTEKCKMQNSYSVLTEVWEFGILYNFGISCILCW